MALSVLASLSAVTVAIGAGAVGVSMLGGTGGDAPEAPAHEAVTWECGATAPVSMAGTHVPAGAITVCHNLAQIGVEGADWQSVMRAIGR